MADQVTMSHPDIPDATPAITSREAFDGVWAAKGWVEVDDADAAKPARRSPRSSGGSGETQE